MDDSLQLTPIMPGMAYNDLVEAVKRNFSVILNAYVAGSNVIEFAGAPGVGGDNGERGSALFAFTDTAFTQACIAIGITAADAAVILQDKTRLQITVERILNDTTALTALLAGNVVVNNAAEFVHYDVLMFSSGILLTVDFTEDDQHNRTFTTSLNPLQIAEIINAGYQQLVTDITTEVIQQTDMTLQPMESQRSIAESYSVAGGQTTTYVPRGSKPSVPDSSTVDTLMFLAIKAAIDTNTGKPKSDVTLIAGSTAQLNVIYKALLIPLERTTPISADATLSMPAKQYAPSLLVVQKATGSNPSEPAANTDMSLPVNKYGITIVDLDRIPIASQQYEPTGNGVSFSDFATIVKHVDGIWIMANSSLRTNDGRGNIIPDYYGKIYLSRSRFEAFITGRYRLVAGSREVSINGNSKVIIAGDSVENISGSRAVVINGADTLTQTGAFSATYNGATTIEKKLAGQHIVKYTSSVSSLQSQVFLNNTVLINNITGTGTVMVNLSGIATMNLAAIGKLVASLITKLEVSVPTAELNFSTSLTKIFGDSTDKLTETTVVDATSITRSTTKTGSKTTVNNVNYDEVNVNAVKNVKVHADNNAGNKFPHVKSNRDVEYLSPKDVIANLAAANVLASNPLKVITNGNARKAMHEMQNNVVRRIVQSMDTANFVNGTAAQQELLSGKVRPWFITSLDLPMQAADGTWWTCICVTYQTIDRTSYRTVANVAKPIMLLHFVSSNGDVISIDAAAITCIVDETGVTSTLQEAVLDMAAHHYIISGLENNPAASKLAQAAYMRGMSLITVDGNIASVLCTINAVPFTKRDANDNHAADAEPIWPSQESGYINTVGSRSAVSIACTMHIDLTKLAAFGYNSMLFNHGIEFILPTALVDASLATNQTIQDYTARLDGRVVTHGMPKPTVEYLQQQYTNAKSVAYLGIDFDSSQWQQRLLHIRLGDEILTGIVYNHDYVPRFWLKGAYTYQAGGRTWLGQIQQSELQVRLLGASNNVVCTPYTLSSTMQPFAQSLGGQERGRESLVPNNIHCTKSYLCERVPAGILIACTVGTSAEPHIALVRSWSSSHAGDAAVEVEFTAADTLPSVLASDLITGSTTMDAARFLNIIGSTYDPMTDSYFALYQLSTAGTTSTTWYILRYKINAALTGTASIQYIAATAFDVQNSTVTFAKISGYQTTPYARYEVAGIYALPYSNEFAVVCYGNIAVSTSTYFTYTANDCTVMHIANGICKISSVRNVNKMNTKPYFGQSNGSLEGDKPMPTDIDDAPMLGINLPGFYGYAGIVANFECYPSYNGGSTMQDTNVRNYLTYPGAKQFFSVFVIHGAAYPFDKELRDVITSIDAALA